MTAPEITFRDTLALSRRLVKRLDVPGVDAERREEEALSLAYALAEVAHTRLDEVHDGWMLHAIAHGEPGA